MLQASSLASLAYVRHAFFTRSGGVSQGVYASLNGGVGSRDVPGNVAENRARMAAALGVPADHLLTLTRSILPTSWLQTSHGRPTTGAC